MIKRFKPAYQLYNFFRKPELVHNVPLYRKYGIDKKYYSSVSSADFKHLTGETNKYDALDSATGLTEESVFQELEERFKAPLLDWSKNGYAILPEFFSVSEVETLNEEVDSLISSGKAQWKYGKKIMFANHYSSLIKNTGNHPVLISILSMLMGKEVDLFQSINFIEGSEQKSHSDSFHMTTFPLGNLIAVWIALEDIKAGSGPLHYYPGSHKLPYVMNDDFGNNSTKLMLGQRGYGDYTKRIEQVVEENALQKEVFYARKGDLLIWHANLLHGGEPMEDKNSSRKSMVFHYYSRDAICFHEITERPTLKPNI